MSKVNLPDLSLFKLFFNVQSNVMKNVLTIPFKNGLKHNFRNYYFEMKIQLTCKILIYYEKIQNISIFMK